MRTTKNSKGGCFQKVSRIEENLSYTEENSNDFEILADLQPSETTTMYIITIKYNKEAETGSRGKYWKIVEISSITMKTKQKKKRKAGGKLLHIFHQ